MESIPLTDRGTALSSAVDDTTIRPPPSDLDDPDAQGEEFKLLADPNLPDSPTDPDPSSDSDAEEENSPFPEVRAAVRSYDEPDLPCNTLRAWTIGLTLVVAGAAMNTLFSLRQPSIGVGPLIAQVVAWPMGHAWARLVPDWDVLGVRLNPGKFNIKEHSVIVVMASVSFGVAYATDIILAQLVFYKQDFGVVFQLLLTISTQSLGYGIAGILRKFLGEWPLWKDERVLTG